MTQPNQTYVISRDVCECAHFADDHEGGTGHCQFSNEERPFCYCTGFEGCAEFPVTAGTDGMTPSQLQFTQRVQEVGEEEMAVADRAVLVVLRQGSASALSAMPPQASEVVQGVASWDVTSSESLELYSASKDLVATFRDWSFVKFMDAKK